MSNRIMLDGIGTDAAPITAALKAKKTFGGVAASMGAGYCDGEVSAWSSADWVEVTAAGQPVTITVTGVHTTATRVVRVADIENGDLTPATGALWAAREITLGQYPVLYVNRSNKPGVISACSAAGLTLGFGPRQYGLWVATLDGGFLDLDGTDLRNHAGIVAVQYLSAEKSGIPADVSLVTDASWIPAPGPKPPVVPPAPDPPAWVTEAVAYANGIAADAAVLAGLLKAHQ
jgi:hypothetical protein